MPASDSKIAYVIADWGTPELATDARRSILLHRPGSEVIVVEAKSSSLGYSQALNAGIARLNGDAEVVCCLNADVLMLESDEQIRFRFRLDERLAIVGPRQINDDGLIAHGGIVAHEDGTDWDLDLRHRCWLWEADAADALTRIDLTVPMVPGSVFYVRRDVLDDLGGWPEWTEFYYEDAWLCYLARHYGWRVLYTGSVTWMHYGERSPLSSGQRALRMDVARRRFVDECDAAGIPLRIWPDDSQESLAAEAASL